MATASIVAYLWHETGTIECLVAQLAIIPLWLFLRFSVPRTGYIGKKLTLKSDEVRFLTLALIPLAIFVAAIQLYETFGNHGNKTAVYALTFVCCFAVMLILAHRLGRRQQQRQREAVEQASDRLEQLEAELFAHPNS